MEKYKILMALIECYSQYVFLAVDAYWYIVIKCIASPNCWKSHVPGPEVEVRQIFLIFRSANTTGSRDNQVLETEGFVFDARRKPLSSCYILTFLFVGTSPHAYSLGPARNGAHCDSR